MTIGDVGLLLCGILFLGGGLFFFQQNQFKNDQRWEKLNALIAIDILGTGCVFIGVLCLGFFFRSLGT